jgi:hypothetical protein
VAQQRGELLFATETRHDGGAHRVAHERRVVGQYRGLNRAHLRPRVDAELFGEHRAQAPAGRQRLGLPAVAIERQHEVGPAAFP